MKDAEEMELSSPAQGGSDGGSSLAYLLVLAILVAALAYYFGAVAK